MSIASEITSLQNNLQAAKNSIIARGGTTGDTGLAGLATEIATIPAGESASSWGRITLGNSLLETPVYAITEYDEYGFSEQPYITDKAKMETFWQNYVGFDQKRPVQFNFMQDEETGEERWTWYSESLRSQFTMSDSEFKEATSFMIVLQYGYGYAQMSVKRVDPFHVWLEMYRKSDTPPVTFDFNTEQDWINFLVTVNQAAQGNLQHLDINGLYITNWVPKKIELGENITRFEDTTLNALFYNSQKQYNSYPKEIDLSKAKNLTYIQPFFWIGGNGLEILNVGDLSPNIIKKLTRNAQLQFSRQLQSAASPIKPITIYGANRAAWMEKFPNTPRNSSGLGRQWTDGGR